MALDSGYFAKDTNVPSKDVPDANVGKWIPVTERLPASAIDGREISENVIVHTIEDEVTTGWLDGSGHDVWWLVVGDNDYHTDHERGYVTHWMPLPNAPEGE